MKAIGGVLIVNDGSVGKPKDGDPRAAWALCTVEAGQPVQVEIRRIPYDVAQHGRRHPRRGRALRPLRAGHRDGRAVRRRESGVGLVEVEESRRSLTP